MLHNFQASLENEHQMRPILSDMTRLKQSLNSFSFIKRAAAFNSK